MCDGQRFRYPGACIAIFARAPELGQVKTRLAAGMGAEAALEIYRRLLEQTLDTVAASRLAAIELHVDGDTAHPLLRHFAEQAGAVIVPQRGADLGERMYLALEGILQSHNCALLIGTDCPVMGEGYLGNALQRLANGTEVVVGPSEDGGYVLIGATRVDKRVFQNVSWGSDQVMQQTRNALCEAGINFDELEVLWDVDHPEDYQRWAREEIT